MAAAIPDPLLQRLVDREACCGLARAYMRALDRLDRDLHLSVFHPDATIDVGLFKGDPVAFVDFAHALLREHLSNQHMIGQIEVEFDADPEVAFGEVYYQAYHRIATEAGERDLFIAGRYVDRYERRAGVWKMAHRTELLDWSRLDLPADETLRDGPMLKGARGADDLSSQREKVRKL